MTKRWVTSAVLVLSMFVSLHVGPASASPEEPGPHAVGFFDITFSNRWGDYDAMVYYPAGEYGYDAPLDNTDERYPALSFAPGVGSTHNSYSWFGEHMASWGFVVIIWTPPDINAAYHQRRDGHLEALEILDDMKSGGKLRGRIELQEIGVAGHSYGATGTLLAVPEDSRIKAAVALASYVGEHYTDMLDAAGKTSAAVQLQAGTSDLLCPPGESESYYDMLRSVPKELVVIEGADHEAFCCFDGPHMSTIKRYTTSWFMYHLKHDKSYDSYVCGADAQSDVESGLLAMHSIEQCEEHHTDTDLNRDGTTDILDLVLVEKEFGKLSGFTPGADPNGDGVIDVFDLVLVVKSFGG